MNARRGSRQDHVPFMKQCVSQFGADKNTALPWNHASRQTFRSSTFSQADPAVDAHYPRPSFDRVVRSLGRDSTRVEIDEGWESTDRAIEERRGGLNCESPRDPLWL